MAMTPTSAFIHASDDSATDLTVERPASEAGSVFWEAIAQSSDMAFGVACDGKTPSVSPDVPALTQEESEPYGLYRY